jgi:hypothetical protein
MRRKSETPVRPIMHVPVRIDWTDERLQALTQEQLLSLLDNLDRQRAIGRIPSDAAQTLDRRISALLTGRNGSKRRKRLAGLAIAEVEEPQ